MDAILGMHRQLATVLVLYYAFVGLWGLVNGIRNLGPTSGLRGGLVIAEVAAIAQGLMGMVLFFFYRAPSDSLHILYGVAMVVAMPLAATYTRDRAPRGQALALGFAALFTAGLAIRGITTAG